MWRSNRVVILLSVFVGIVLVLASVSVSGQHPLKTDTDGDGIPDGWEVEHGLNPNDVADAQLDYNYNGRTNFQEYQNASDPWDKDSDDDGISNYAECWALFGFFTDPLVSDTDGDGLSDLDEICTYIDTSNEAQMKEIILNETGIEKMEKITNLSRTYPYKLDPTNPDVDGDGLSDGDELLRTNKTNPNCVDSDSDGLSDGDEVHVYKTEPKKRDTDCDGLTDYEEGTYGTDPTKWDTDGDGISDGEEIFGFGFAPIGPSEHAVRYDEFISGAYSGYITLKARVDLIRYNPELSSYLVFLNPLESKNETEGKRGVARVNSSWHYDFEHGELMHVDSRFGLALRDGDTIVVVGKAGKILGNTREIEVDNNGSIYLVLSPEEARERWLPSREYVKIISDSKTQASVQTSNSTTAVNSSSTLNQTSTPTSLPSPVSAMSGPNETNETNATDAGEPEGIFGLLSYIAIGTVIVVASLFLYAKISRRRKESDKSFWTVSGIKEKGENEYEVLVNKDGKEARITINKKMHNKLVSKGKLVFGEYTISIP
jgi:hypothetical protein